MTPPQLPPTPWKINLLLRSLQLISEVNVAPNSSVNKRYCHHDFYKEIIYQSFVQLKS